MAWNEAVVTNDGLELLARCVMGGSIEITSAAGGECVSPSVALMAIKDIDAPRHELNVAKIERIKNGVTVNVRVQNNGLAEGYCLRQIGIFARLSESGEEPILLAVIQDQNGEEVPTEEENPEYLLEYDFVIPLSNAENIAVSVTPGTFATLDDFSEMSGHIRDKSNPHNVNKEQVGLGNVPNVATNDQTPTYNSASSLAELASGENLGTAFGKIAKAVKDLIGHLADSVRHVTAAERSAWNGKAAGNHAHEAATSSANGFMSREDKTKLDGIAAGANKYTHPSTSGNNHIPSGGKSGQILRWSADGTAAWGADNNTTYGAATQSADGLMSAADKTKLDGIDANANNYTHPTTAGNKHIPAGGKSGQILRWSSAGTATWGDDNDTVYTHPAYTARTGVPTANQTPAFGSTFSVSQPVSDASGHITALTSRTVKIPNTAATASKAGLMSAADKTKLDAIKLSGFNATFGNVAVNVSSHTVTINHKVDMLIVFFNQHETGSSATAANVVLTPSVTSASIMYGSVKLTCSDSSATVSFTFVGVNSQNRSVQNYAALQLS